MTGTTGLVLETDAEEIAAHVAFLRRDGGGSAGFTADLLEAAGRRFAKLEEEVKRLTVPAADWQPSSLQIACREFVEDWRKGDFDLPRLAALDAESMERILINTWGPGK